MKFLMRYADNRHVNSIANRFRRKRFELFKSLIEHLLRPLRILDVGGTQEFWEMMNFSVFNDIEIIILNLINIKIILPNFKNVIGDARKMEKFRDKEFDVVFSNSVIEHVGDYSQQKRMAEEIIRVGKGYFVQTPNRYFPLEPHFLFPFFNFLPMVFKVFLIRNFNLGYFNKTNNKQKSIAIVSSIRLLNEKELKELFPGGQIFKEKVFGFTKSLIVYDFSAKYYKNLCN